MLPGVALSFGMMPGNFQRAAVGGRHVVDHFTRLILRIFDDVLDRINPAGRHAGGVQLFQGVLQGLRDGPRGDRGVEFADARHAAIVVRQAGIVPKIGAVDHFHQALENPVAVARDQQVAAVFADIRVRRRDAGQRGAGRLADHAAAIIFRQRALHHVEDGFVERDVDHLAAAAVNIAMIQRHQQPDESMQRGQRIADGNPDPHRCPAGFAGKVAQAAHRFADDAETGTVAIRPGLAVAGNTQHDELGIQRVSLLPAEVPLLQLAGPEIFDHHVHLLHQLAHHFLAFGGVQVERDGLFVARLHLPPERRAALVEQAPFAQRIADAGRLDFDHLGTEIGERLGGEGSGDERAEFQDAHAFQGQASGGG